MRAGLLPSRRFGPRRRRAHSLLPILLLPVLLLTMAAAPASGPPNVVQARSASAVVLSDTGGILQTVESVTLAQGSWTVTSNATAVNFGAGDYVRCQLDVNSQLIDGGATTYLANRVNGLVNTATWKSGTSFTVALRCDHDHAAVTAGQFYFDPGVTLTAVRGGPIASPTVHGSGAPTVVQSRTTSSVALDSVFPPVAPVASATLLAGTWAVIANVTAVNFSDFDWASCYLAISSGGYIVSSAPFVGVSSPDTYVSGVTVEATAVVPAGGGTVMLECRSDYARTIYLDPGATLTATLVPVAKHLVTDQIGSVTLPDTGGSAADVISQHVPSGSWRITTEVVAGLANPNGSVGGVTDFVRCGLWAGTTRIDGGATILVDANGNIQELVNAGSYTSTTGWTLRLSCAHDTTISTGQHWTIFDGMAQALNKGPVTTTP